MEPDATLIEERHGRPRRQRCDSTRAGSVCQQQDKNLHLSDVLAVLKGCDDFEGGINCRVCGKLYKSKVCYTKHLWEHSVYWDMFEGDKNHDRVLSIQAAVILWNKCQASPHHQSDSSNDQSSSQSSDDLESLLVTSPHKKDKDINGNEIQKLSSPQKRHSTPIKKSSPVKKLPSTPKKRVSQQKSHGKKRHLAAELSSAFSGSDMGSPIKFTRQS